MVLCVLSYISVYYYSTLLYALQCVTPEESSQYFSSPDKTNQTTPSCPGGSKIWIVPPHSFSPSHVKDSVFQVWYTIQNCLLFLNSGIHILANFQPRFAEDGQPQIFNSVLKVHVVKLMYGKLMVLWDTKLLVLSHLTRTKLMPKESMSPSYRISDFHFDVRSLGWGGTEKRR